MSRTRDLGRALIVLAALLTAGPAAAEPVDDLLSLLAQRLEIGRAVAEAKWNSGAPIADPAREAEVLATARTQATAASVDPQAMEALIRAQIEASKLLQQQLHAEWRREARPPFSNPPDLGKQIRPKLDLIGRALPAALAAALPTLAGECGELERRAGEMLAAFDAPVREQAIEPLEDFAGCQHP